MQDGKKRTFGQGNERESGQMFKFLRLLESKIWNSYLCYIYLYKWSEIKNQKTPILPRWISSEKQLLSGLILQLPLTGFFKNPRSSSSYRYVHDGNSSLVFKLGGVTKIIVRQGLTDWDRLTNKPSELGSSNSIAVLNRVSSTFDQRRQSWYYSYAYIQYLHVYPLFGVRCADSSRHLHTLCNKKGVKEGISRKVF